MKIINSFRYALEGLSYVFATQRNLRIHIFALLLVICSGWFFKISKIEWLFVIIISCVVISLEIVNTAIETVVDIVVKGYNIKAKIAKDVAAGAVLLAAFCAVIVGLIIFLPKIIVFLF